MSDTPRTDAAVHVFGLFDGKKLEFIYPEFSQNIERELNAANNRVSEILEVHQSVHEEYALCRKLLMERADELIAANVKIAELKARLADIDAQPVVAWRGTDALNPNGWVTNIDPKRTLLEFREPDVTYTPLIAKPASNPETEKNDRT